MLNVVVIVFLVGVVASVPHSDSDWDVFKAKHGKVYGGDIDLIRKAIWKDNHKLIKRHNEDFAKGLTSFYMGENEFTDMTHEEFSNTMKGFVMSNSNGQPEEQENSFLPKVQVPAEVNWVKKGLVTPVRNQKGCNASYAFASICSLESIHAKGGGPPLEEFSVQQIIDCTGGSGNKGCNGGDVKLAFKGMAKMAWVSTDASYPYKAKAGKCGGGVFGSTVTGFTEVIPRTENALRDKTYYWGPVAAGINGGLESFRHYKGGIYDDPNCNATNLDHSVAVVGYGVQKNQDYWLLKNSWGTSWGEKGYMMMVRNKNNTCGIASHASSPNIWDHHMHN